MPLRREFIEHADAVAILGAALPLIRLSPDSPVQAIKAELALAHYGLRPI